jgi:hypothetical protein
MKKLIIIMLTAVSSLVAADYSGIWNGTGGKEDTRYGSVPATAQMTLLQAGSSFQGTLKMGSGAPMAISSGAVSGSTLTFVIKSTGGAQVTGNFTANGSQLTGKMTASNGQVYDFVFTKK